MIMKTINREKLIEVFGNRPTRMKLLKDSINRINLNEKFSILETGCSFGDGIACACEYSGADGYAVDMEKDYIAEAQRRHENISFTCGSVYDLDYENEKFDLVFSQAAFSLLKDKEKAVSEYRRVLKNTGYVMINDFVAKESVGRELKEDMDFIPCFNSIGTIDEYIRIYESMGFEIVLAEDRYSEIISTTLHLSKKYKCTPMEMASLFAGILGNSGDSEEKCQCFFKKTEVSYAQLIFRKKAVQ